MGTEKKHFFLKLNPPRASFMVDMNEEERQIMLNHIAFWKPFVENGTVIVLGPVMDPKGGFGIAVVALDNEEELTAIISKDPAN